MPRVIRSTNVEILLMKIVRTMKRTVSQIDVGFSYFIENDRIHNKYLFQLKFCS